MTPATPPAPRAIVLAAVVVLALATVRLAAGPGPDPAGDRSPAGPPANAARATPQTAPVAEARDFLDEYVVDGRVVRHDEGGDTVSEGQAWALLVAVALEDVDHATAVVAWTEEHLAREDGMLAWRWADGAVVDEQSAADADLVYAWALARGARVFDRPGWLDRADRTVDALADTSVIRTPDGPLLTAGPWATTGSPTVVNPSYLWPAPLRWAQERTGRLHGTLTATTDLLSRLVHDDTPLVPDWVTVTTDGDVAAVGRPGQEGPPRHGLDAVRTWLWLAGDCDPQVRALAADVDRFDPDPSRVVAEHDLDGTPTVEWRHPATLAGAAAVAHAAGDEALRDARLAAATRLQREHPTYYGAAVLALARLALDTDLLAGCDVTA